MTRHIKASEFKAKCLALMDEVERTGKPLIITKKGKPVAELVPHKTKKKPELLGLLKDSLFITGDIISPVDVDWNLTTQPDPGGSRRERLRRTSSARRAP